MRKIFEWIISRQLFSKSCDIIQFIDLSSPAQPRPIALKQLITLPLSSFEEKILNEFVQKPPNAIPFSSIAILQDLICVRLIQGGRYSEAIKLDKLFTSTTPQKHVKDTHDRSRMVQNVYNALPTVEKALLGLDLDSAPLRQQKPSPKKPVSPKNSRQAVAGEDQTMSLSQSWEDVRVPESLVQKSTPLRDVRLPQAATFPVRPHGPASGTTPRKNLPFVSTVPSSSARPVSQQQPLLLSVIGSRTAYGTPNAIASPASGIKLSSSTNFRSSHGPSPSFVSASQQRNAFYQPPVKSNGVKRAFEDESRRSPDHDDNASSDSESPQADVRVEPEGGDKRYEDETTTRQARAPSIEESDDEDNKALQYSLFGAKKGSSKRNVDAPKKKLGGHGHESYRIDDEDESMEIYEQPEREQKKPAKTRSGRTTRATQQKAAATMSLSKPPAKKAKQIKDVVRHIPGGLMEEDDDDDDEEEQDQVMALPTTRIPRNSSRAGVVKGKRKAPSVDNTDEMEVGVQTRRRSSRLTAGSSGRISPEPVVVAPKTRRAAGRTSTASKKKR